MRRYNSRTAAMMSATAIAVLAVAPTIVTASGASASDKNKQDEQRREQAKKLEEKQREDPKRKEKEKEKEHDDGDDDGDHDGPIVLTPPTTVPSVTVAPTTAPSVTVAPTTAPPTVPPTAAPTTVAPPTTAAPTTTKPVATTTTTKAPVVTTTTTVAPAPLIRASAAFLASKIGAPVRMDTTVTNDAASPAAVTVVITMSSTGALPGYLEAKALTGTWACSAYAAKPVSPQKYTCTGTLAAKTSGVITVSSGSSIVGTAGQTLIAGIVVNPGGIATGATAALA